MTSSAEAAVHALEAARASFGRDAARAKLRLLARALRARVTSGELLYRLHETLLFVRAFPDTPATARAAEAALGTFAARVRALAEAERDAIDERGVAGTSIYTSYSLPVVRSLALRHPGEVTHYAEAEGAEAAVATLLAGGLLPAEAEATADGYVPPLDWLARARALGPGQGDLARLLALIEAATPDDRLRDLLWQASGVSIRWQLGVGSGSRTRARAPEGKRGYQSHSFNRGAVDLTAEVARGPLPVERAAGRTARAWLDLCRDVLAARLREVHTYNHGSLADIHVADAGQGLRIATVGVVPGARHAVRTFVGYLLVKNDVPIGYGDAVLLCDWAEINFHVFDTFRQAESAATYAAVLRLFRHRYGTRFVFLNRYQFGHHNEDAIRSGAFWFYEKLGFRPHDAEAVRIWREERAHLARDASHRTSAPRLRTLARSHMDLVLAPGHEGEAKASELRGFHPMTLGLAVTREVERRFRGDCVRAARVTGSRLRARLGRSLGEPLAGDMGQALEGLAPLLELGIMLDTWSRSEIRGLASVIRAKAARSERDFVLCTQDHPRLRDALLRLGGGSARPAAARGGRHVPQDPDPDRRK